MKKRELLTVVSTALVSTSILLLVFRQWTEKRNQHKKETRLITSIQKDEARRKLPYVFVFRFRDSEFTLTSRTNSHTLTQNCTYVTLERQELRVEIHIV